MAEKPHLTRPQPAGSRALNKQTRVQQLFAPWEAPRQLQAAKDMLGAVWAPEIQKVQDMTGKNSPLAGRDHVNEERMQGVVKEAAECWGQPEAQARETDTAL